MKNVPTFKEIFKLTHKISLNGTWCLTLLYINLFFLIGLEVSSFNLKELINFSDTTRELWLLGVVIIFIAVWNYLTCIFGIYLMITSFVLSKKYGRFLVVLFGVIFVLTIFHVIPVNELKESYRWFTSLYMRFMQGLILVSMVITSWGVIQGLVIYIIGRDDSGNSSFKL